VEKVIDRKQLKTRDRIGGTIITELYTKEDGTYTAYSFYRQDENEECVALATGVDPDKTVRQSRKNLREEWCEWKDNPMTEEPYFKIIMASGEVITSNLKPHDTTR
jgi:hypothetical protein